MAPRALDTQALLLRRTAYQESDLVVCLLTETTGSVAALARGARKSQKRFGGALEPFHTLRVRLEERDGKELMTLREATIAVARRRVVSDLDRMQAAGRVLGWVRRAAAPRVRERDVWSSVLRLLDELEESSRVEEPVVETGLRLLQAWGWGLELDQCVMCGRECAAGKAAFIDPARGGLVCRSCGGARTRLTGTQREQLRAAAAGAKAFTAGDAAAALDLVERSLRAHLGFD